MAAVLRFIDNYSSRESSMVILRGLIKRVLSGEIVGLAICFRSRHGGEYFLFSGVYQSHPPAAVNAAQRMAKVMLQRQEGTDPALS